MKLTTAAGILPISDLNLNRRRKNMTLLSLRRRNFSSFFLLSSPQIRPFSSSPSPIRASLSEPVPSPARKVRVRVRAKSSTKTVKEVNEKLKLNWLTSLSAPPPPELAGDVRRREVSDPSYEWVIGIDPDHKGALALLKGNGSHCSVQVFDNPNMKMLLGGKLKTRLDTKSMIELLRSFDAPVGTTAYVEQSVAFPTDGRQGCWSTGFVYGQWIGSLVALGFSVIPVSSMSWKKKFEIHGRSYTKDDSRRAASTLFPSMGSFLKRKLDHGRADALLIAAYGRAMKMESEMN